MTREAHLRLRPDVAAGVALLAVYAATLARGVTYWDAGEFLAAIHSLGIPHPPGTPLFVLAARTWSMLASPVLGFTIAVNAFSALCTAVACAVVANLFWRWTGDALTAWCAAVAAGLTSTVWLGATETEVYAAALALSLLVAWIGDRAGRSGDRRWLYLLAYAAGLAWSLHLTALLGLPLAIALAWRPLARTPLAAWLRAAPLVAAGMSAVLFMLVRARHDPAINQGNPATLAALLDVVQRRQYDVQPLWPRRAPLWLQFANIFEYADWQWALGLAPEPPPTFLRTSITLAYAVLGLIGARAHWRRDAASFRGWLLFLIATSVGVVLYLNHYAGASFGVGVLPANAVHEARDRDYFYTWAFVAWGAWSGTGAAALARVAGRHLRVRSVLAPALAGTLVLAPCVLNWRAIRIERRDDQRRAETGAEATLRGLPPRAVFLAIGDNDTYPLWYLQQVKRMRRDVTVVTVPLLGPAWYRAELQRRYALLDSAAVAHWRGTAGTVSEIRAHAAAQCRPVVGSPLAR